MPQFMSLDNIQLTPSLLRQLYGKCLYEFNTAATQATAGEALINSLGYNEKNILIVVDEPNAVHVQEADLKLLTGILTACKLSLADVALVNKHKNENASFSSLNNSFTPRVILLFGIAPPALGFPLHFPHFQLQQYNGQQYISSPSLQALALDKGLKKQLWDILQKLF